MFNSFTILVTGSPTSSQAHLSAMRFINAAIALKCSIKNVFFYQEAVHVANRFICKPSDEAQLTQRWSQLAKAHNFELQVCVAASNRRAVISDEEAKQNGLDASSLHSAFSILGLGQLAVELSNRNNQFIQFK